MMPTIHNQNLVIHKRSHTYNADANYQMSRYPKVLQESKKGITKRFKKH